MKTNFPLSLPATLLGLALCPGTAGVGRDASSASVPATTTVISAANSSTAWNMPILGVQVAILPSGYHPSDKWDDVKDYGFDLRQQLFAGLHQVEARLDRQIAELKVKRARMRYTAAETKDWDQAMQEMENARYELQCRADDLSKATYETWEFQRERVTKALKTIQVYYSKVKDSTTAE